MGGTDNLLESWKAGVWAAEGKALWWGPGGKPRWSWQIFNTHGKNHPLDVYWLNFMPHFSSKYTHCSVLILTSQNLTLILVAFTHTHFYEWENVWRKKNWPQKPELLLHQGTALTEVLLAHFDKSVQVIQVNHDRNGRRKKEKNCESGSSHTHIRRGHFSFFILFDWKKPQKTGGYTRTVYLQTGKHTKWAESFIWYLLLINTKWAETFTWYLLLINTK